MAANAPAPSESPCEQRRGSVRSLRRRWPVGLLALAVVSAVSLAAPAPARAFPPNPIDAIEDVLGAGVSESAATVHYVDEGIDTGPVIVAERVPVLPDDTAESLRARVQAVEHRLLPETVRSLI